MQIAVLEEEKDKLKIEVKGASETLVRLIAAQVWKEGGQAAAFKEHPLTTESKILVEGANPKKLLKEASKIVEEQADELKEELKNALKEYPATAVPSKQAGIQGPEEFEESGQ